MLTLGQRVVVYSVLLFLNLLFLVFFGLLAVIPIMFSIAVVVSLRKL